MAKQRVCGRCGKPGHRADTCPTGPAKEKGIRAEELVGVLVEAAESLGETKALAAVEEATTEVLRQSEKLRLALIKSRAANRKLRAKIEDEKTAKDLERLDQEEGGQS